MDKVIVESMTHCEAEVVTKEIPKSKNYEQKIKMILETMRMNKFQAVVWDGETYLGGTWYDPIQQKWTAEFKDYVWRDANEFQND
ncbi:hypothetical protein [Desulfovulcanus sp.]